LEDAIAVFDGLSKYGVGVVEFTTHAGVLRSLAGEEEGDFGAFFGGNCGGVGTVEELLVEG
jgi:hypothetical protein